MSKIRGRVARLTGAAVMMAAVTVAPADAGVEVAGTRVAQDLPLVSSNIDVIATIPAGGVVGATFRGSLMYATGVDGLTIFDIANPALPVMLGRLPVPGVHNEDVSLGGNTLLISNDWFVGGRSTAVVTVVDVSNPVVPTIRAVHQPAVGTHTATCIADCRYAWLAGGTGINVLDTVTGAVTHAHATDVIGGTHDVQVDSSGYAWVVGSAGTGAFTFTNPRFPALVAKTNAQGSRAPLNSFIHHNSARPDNPDGSPGDIVYITEEDWIRPRCTNAGLFETWRITGPLSTTSPAVLEPIDDWNTDEGLLPTVEETEATVFCSAHYFDVRDGFVAMSWYQQGTRILTVDAAGAIRQHGWFVPSGTNAWSAYWAPTSTDGSIVYALDHHYGIHVLRVHRDEVATDTPPSTSSIAPGPDVQPHPTFGWACRIAV